MAQTIEEQEVSRRGALELENGRAAFEERESKPFDILDLIAELIRETREGRFFPAQDSPPGGSGPQRTSDIHLSQQIPVRRRQR